MPINPIQPAPQYAQWVPRQYEGLAAGVQAGLAIRKNKLAEQEMAEDKQREERFQNALGRQANANELYSIDPQRAMGYSAMQAQQTLIDQRRQEQEDAAFAEVSQLASRSLALNNPAQARAMVSEYVKSPRGKRALEALGYSANDALADVAGVDDQGLSAMLQSFAAFGEQSPEIQQIEGPNGSTIITRGNQMSVVQPPKPDKPEKAPNTYRALTPQEVEAAGLPAGTSAQVDSSGKIDVLSKRDTTATLSQKDANTAKLKLNTVRVARNQLNKIKQAYEQGIAGAGPNAFGGAQGWMPTQAGKKFDAAVDQMRSTLTALTRVPGVGAMSDYETRLDQAKFPSRTDYESVTAEKIQGIDDMLNAIETGYSDLLSGGSQAGASSSQLQAAPAQREITATGPNGQKIVLRNGQWVPL